MVQRATSVMLPIGGDPRIEKVLMKKLIFLNEERGGKKEKIKGKTRPHRACIVSFHASVSRPVAATAYTISTEPPAPPAPPAPS